MKKNLAFDFDDVLCDTTKAFLLFHKKKYGSTIPYTTAKVVLYKNLHISEKEEDKRWNEFFQDTTFYYPAPAKNLIEILQILKKNYRLIVISARDKKWQHNVFSWIEKYVPNIFEEIIFLDSRGVKKSKGMICRKNKTIALIEDDPEHIKSCVDFEMPVIVFDRPWNKKLKKSIPRIKSLSQIKKILSTKF